MALVVDAADMLLAETRTLLDTVESWDPKPPVDTCTRTLRTLLSMETQLDQVCDRSANTPVNGEAEALLARVVQSISRLIGIVSATPSQLTSPAPVMLGYEPAVLLTISEARQLISPRVAPPHDVVLVPQIGVSPPPTQVPTSPLADALRAKTPSPLIPGLADEGVMMAVPKQRVRSLSNSHPERHEFLLSVVPGAGEKLSPRVAGALAREIAARRASVGGDVEIPSSEIVFSSSDLIGTGDFGHVYRATVRGQPVAAKVLARHTLTEDELEQFRHELCIMRRVNHPNVVMFLGACTEPGKLTIVTQLMNCDFESVIHGPKRATLTLHKRLHLMLEAARGMNWLHGICNIAHRDLKPANLLLDENGSVHVGDFGFSQIIRAGQKVRDADARKWGIYAAPEVIGGGSIDLSADVYSFGIILWEALTSQAAFCRHVDPREFIEAVVLRNERPDVRDIAPPKVVVLMKLCWDAIPTKRPSFSTIVQMLEECIIEAILEGDAALFWRSHFTNPLLEAVPWESFRNVISNSFDLAKLQDPLAQSISVQPPSGVHTRQLDPDYFGLAGLLCETTVKEMPVTMERVALFSRWFGGFNRRSVIEADSLGTQPWFHGFISKEIAANRLRARAEGTFLVRTSERYPDAPFTVSAVVNSQLTHFRVVRSADRLFIGMDTEGPRAQDERKFVNSSTLAVLIARMQKAGLVKSPCPRIAIPY